MPDGERAQHLDAARGFADREWRGAEIHEQLRSLRDERIDGRGAVEPAREEFLVPNILANGDADFHPGDLDRRDGRRWFKVSVFVEYVVRRQKRLVKCPDRLPALEEGGGVVKGLPRPGVRVDESDNQRHASDFAMERFERGQVQRDEARFEYEILRRISGDREFRGDDEFRAAFDETMVCRDDFAVVFREGTDGGIDLREADFHASESRRTLMSGVLACRCRVGC